MTNKEKKAILLKAIEIVKGYPDNRDNSGMCWALGMSLGHHFIPEAFPEYYGISLPARKYFSRYALRADYSFPLTKEGDTQRIALLEEAIKKL